MSLPPCRCCANLVFTADLLMHSSNFRSKSWNSKYRAWNPSARAPLWGGRPLCSCSRACRTSLADTKNTLSPASLPEHSLSSFTRKSTALSKCWARTWGTDWFLWGYFKWNYVILNVHQFQHPLHMDRASTSNTYKENDDFVWIIHLWDGP